MKKLIEIAVYIVGAAVLIWLLASFIDVNLHNTLNCKNYGVYQSWNAFKLFSELMEILK